MDEMALPDEIARHYGGEHESERLLHGVGQLERARTEEILGRYLPPPPARVLDVGGGAGVYALWLARLGYEVHLMDAVEGHIEQAIAAASMQPEHPFASAEVGDARNLSQRDECMDAVLLLGPMYHLTERADRLKALTEARRVVRRGGFVFVAAISRFASALDGLFRGYLDDPEFAKIVEQDLLDGQHRNPSGHPAYFTTAFFHHPSELKSEVEESGLDLQALIGLEGPTWLLQNFEQHWNDLGRRERLLEVVRRLESEPTLAGMSAHILAVARK